MRIWLAFFFMFSTAAIAQSQTIYVVRHFSGGDSYTTYTGAVTQAQIETELKSQGVSYDYINKAAYDAGVAAQPQSKIPLLFATP